MFKMGIVAKEKCSFLTISQKQFCIFFGNVDMLGDFWRALIKWLSGEFQNIFTNWPKIDIIFGNRGIIKYNCTAGKKTHLSKQS